MRLVQSSSRWGVGYRFRHWIDGKRVSRDAFDNAFHASEVEAHKGAATSYGWRDEWQTKEPN